jgi:hypothetical protein
VSVLHPETSPYSLYISELSELNALTGQDLPVCDMFIRDRVKLEILHFKSLQNIRLCHSIGDRFDAFRTSVKLQG